jgi:hypothetical protein
VISLAAKPCIRCGRISEEKHKYCIRCGAPLVNRCTNDGGLLGEPCNKINKQNAVFCMECGTYTTFYKAGLLHSNHAGVARPVEDELRSMNHFNHPFFED